MSKVEDELQGLFDRVELIARDTPSLCRKAPGRDHANLVAPGVRLMVESGCTRPQFNMATQAVPSRGDGNDSDKFAMPIIDQVS